MSRLTSIADNTGTLSATSSNTAVVLIAAGDDLISRVIFVNEGAVAGYGKIGGTYYHLPANSSVTVKFPSTPIANPGIAIQRQSGGSDMTGCWAYAS